MKRRRSGTRAAVFCDSPVGHGAWRGAWIVAIGLAVGGLMLAAVCHEAMAKYPEGSCINDQGDQDEGDDDCPQCGDSPAAEAAEARFGEVCYTSELLDPNAPPARTTDAPILLRRGSVVERATDLALPGPVFGWAHTRTYDSAMTTGIPLEDNAGENGQRWAGGPHAFYIKQNGNNIELYTSASHKRTFTPGQNNFFTPPAGTNATLQRIEGSLGFPPTPETYKLTMNRSGDVYIFYGFDSETVEEKNQGWLMERTTRRYLDEVIPGVRYSYDPRGLVETITTAGPQSYWILYEHSQTDGTYDLLTKIEIYDGVPPSQQGSGTKIAEVEYTYCDSLENESADCGTAEDLIQVRVSRLASDGSTWIDRYTQYRYYGPSGTDGKEHQLKMILEPDGVQRACAALSKTPEELLATADTSVVAYASRSFTYYTTEEDTTESDTPWATGENLQSAYGGGNVVEYNSTTHIGRVKTEKIHGACGGCGGSGAGLTNTYFYLTINSASTNVNEVVHIVVEDTTDADDDPEGTRTPVRRTLYGLNYLGQELRRAILADPTAGTLTASCVSTTLNANHQVAESRKPSAHALVDSNAEVAQFLDPYDPSGGDPWSNDKATLEDAAGEILVYEYDGNQYPNGVRSKNGENGTAYYLSAQDNNANGEPTHTYAYTTATTTRTGGSEITTDYAYTHWDDADTNIQTKTVTLPAIASAQNGSGTATVVKEYYDEVGRLRWTKDGEGAVTYYSYHPYSGQLSYKMVDVGSTLPDDIQNGDDTGGYFGEDVKYVAWGSSSPPDGFSASGTLQLVTKYEFDEQGRRTLAILPDESMHYTVYSEIATSGNPVVYQFPYCNASGVPQLPIQASETNAGGRPVASYSIDPARTATSSNVPTGLVDYLNDPTDQDYYVSLTRYGYDATSGSLLYVDRYHDIPSSGDGVLGTNFYQTRYIDDRQGRRAAVVQYVDTISSNVVSQLSVNQFDYLGRVIAVRTDSNTAATMPDEFSDVYASGNYNGDLKMVSATEYDADGQVTRQKSYYDAANPTHHLGAQFYRTYRGHLRATRRFYNAGTETSYGPYTVQDIDWQGRATATAVFTTAPGTWPTDYTAYTTTTSARRELAQNFYDALGRVYQTRRYKVIASTGAANDYFKTDYFYDRNGRRVATAPAYQAATETAYDAAGRAYQTRTVTALQSTHYNSGAFHYCEPTPNPTLGSMTGGNEGVIQMSHTAFDAGGRAIESHTLEMACGDTVNIGISMTTPDYTRETVFSWYDGAGRLSVVANYGCDDGDGSTGPGAWTYVAAPTRAATVPSTADEASESNDTLLITTYGYDATSGRLLTVTTPGGVSGSVTTQPTKTFYDDLGRKTHVVENWVDFTPTSGDAGNTDDKVTQFAYNGLGNLTELVAMNPTTGNQTTAYEYADSYNAALVTKTTYPDEGDVDVTYYLDGQPNTRTDQRDTVLTHVYDAQRRLSYQGATTLGGATDSTTRSIKREYDTMGRVEKITSYSAADGTGTVRNQIQYAYDDLSRKEKIYQEHNGTVVTSGGSASLKTQFAYDDTVSSNVFDDGGRLLTLTYPDASYVSHSYTGTVNDALNRVSSLAKSPYGWGVAYLYGGAGRPASVSIFGPCGTCVRLGYGSSGLDRFARVKRQLWVHSTEIDEEPVDINVVHIAHGYDLAGNRVYREDILAEEDYSEDFDEFYAYDGLNRLADLDRGALNEGKTAIAGTPARAENWTLDALGNWSEFKQDTDGDGNWNLDQDRTHDEANEITDIDGGSWVDPVHDAAGNMTTIPKPASPTTGYTATYDAWNRLVKLQSGQTTEAEYQYDGMNQRIVKKKYTSGHLAETRHFYYNDRWQCVEERLQPSYTIAANPICRYVWGARYIDELILRQRDTDANGTLDETLYAMQDANFNVVALATSDDDPINPSFDVVERFAYDAYGKATPLDPDFTEYSGADRLWEYLYTGRQLDRESGLMYYRNRYYHTGLGRFVTRDPIGYVARSMNLFEYVGSSPSGRIDPSGFAYGDTWQEPELSRICNYLWLKKHHDDPFWPQNPITGETVLGWAGCYKDKVATCVNTELISAATRPAFNLIRQCVLEHEQAHAQQMDCSSTWNPQSSEPSHFACFRPIFGDNEEDVKKNIECDADLRELECYRNYLRSKDDLLHKPLPPWGVNRVGENRSTYHYHPHPPITWPPVSFDGAYEYCNQDMNCVAEIEDMLQAIYDRIKEHCPAGTHFLDEGSETHLE